ncbi:hypothetical protein RDI58_024417 [Solanum bulbocastanum]
MGFDEVF